MREANFYYFTWLNHVLDRPFAGAKAFELGHSNRQESLPLRLHSGRALSRLQERRRERSAGTLDTQSALAVTIDLTRKRSNEGKKEKRDEQEDDSRLGKVIERRQRQTVDTTRDYTKRKDDDDASIAILRRRQQQRRNVTFLHSAL